LTDPNANLRGITAMCLAMAAFIINDAAVKLASQSVSVGQVVFLRGAVAGIGACLLLWQQRAFGELRFLLKPIVALRCLIEGLTAVLFIGALALLPLPTATAILLSSPLMITVAAALFMGETVRWRRWLAVFAGFAGMLIVVRPTSEGLNLGVLLAVASTLLAVTRDLLTRKLPTEIPSRAVAACSIVTTCVVGGGFALLQPWRPVEPQVLWPIAIAALTVAIGNYFIIIAFRSGEVSVVSPFRYTLMVWGVIAGLAVFGDWPDPVTWIGIALIIGSGLYTLYREAIVMRQPG
jgi:drug/metabolite transporter (DMT)-like permease